GHGASRNHWLGQAVRLAAVRGSAVWAGPIARRGPLLHHPAGWDRAWKVQQTQRWTACALSPLRLRRHGGRAAPIARRWAESKPSSPDHWHLDGLHPLVDMG